MTDTLDSHRAMDVAIDEAGKSAQGSVQWLLEKDIDKDAMPTTGNDVKFLVCGQEGFESIANDLIAAKKSVDICCWGFDPGMELVRSMSAPTACWAGDPHVSAQPYPGVWPRGIVYGALLEEITKRADNPVTVRLLLWYDGDGSKVQNSMPGFTDVPVSGVWHPIQRLGMQQDPPYTNPTRNQYCIDWWKRNLPDGKSGGGSNPRLQIVLRSISKADVQALIAADPKEQDAPSTHTEGTTEWLGGVSEKKLLEEYPSHHQKPILIDYDYDDGSKAVGYVMGLNSITDYWDRTAHQIDDPLRETWKPSYVDSELKHEQETQDPKGPLSTAVYSQTNPYQDYACRLVGKALKRLHQNFVNGWNLFAPPKLQATELKDLPSRIPSGEDNPAQQVQIVRTQAHEREKTIKKLYYQATSFARNYIYMENQYFFYPEFARHVKQERQKFHDAWAKLANKPQQDAPMLHLFVVIPHPQDPGMIPRTYDSLAELGHSDAMKGQSDLVSKKKVYQTYKNDRGENTFHPQSLQELQDTIGLKVTIARLRTSGMVSGQMAYREIYIHAKLMIVDDVFVTVGSANMDQRSMSVDSEINVGVTGQALASGLRERVFSLMSNGKISAPCDRDHIPDVFKAWNDLMDHNNDLRQHQKPMEGFLLPFMDQRSKTVLHASIDTPSSTETANTA
ncbi:phospholipase D-like domain-containing protein [Paraburkholderia acidicola]|uniref:Phospholipase D-like domain-containing protein n=1 Tax=Paraburkholderia acidicola TaxID=1912599 RepID=A0ABV1LLN8_9BURK